MSKYKFDFNYNEDSIVYTIAKSVKENSVVLEFGPAYGRLTKHLKEKLNCNVDIVEIDEESGLEAYQYARYSLIGSEKGDIDSFQWFKELNNQKYDYIIFADVLEHLRYPEEVIKKTYNLLKDDGSILISIPNITHNAILINLYNNSFHYTDTGILDETHIRLWGINDFSDMVGKLGYSITDIKPFYLESDNTEQAAFFPDTVKEIKLLFSNRPQGKVYQYFIKLNKKTLEIKEYDINSLLNMPCPLSVYYDIGQGFTEEKKLSYTVLLGKELEKEITLEEDATRIRIDPLEGQFSKVYIKVQDSKNNEYKIHSTNSINKDQSEYYEFITTDPWFIIDGPFSKEQPFKLKVIVKDFPIWEIIERFEQVKTELQNKLNDKNTTIKKELVTVKSLLNKKSDELLSLNQVLIKDKKLVLEKDSKLVRQKRELKEKEVELAETKIELNAKEAELAETKIGLNSKETELAETKIELKTKEAELFAQKEELAKKNIKIEEFKEELQKKTTNAQNLHILLSKKDENLAEVKEQMALVSKNIDSLTHELEMVYNSYNNILNSTCWKCTKPIRLVSDGAKSVYSILKKHARFIATPFAKTIRYIRHYGLKATAKKIYSKVIRSKKVKQKLFQPIKFDFDMEGQSIKTDKSVSIVIPTKNGGDEFELLLMNLNNQKGFNKIEIVIVDSGSTDKTIEIARKYDTKIIEIKPEDFSHSYSRNLGVENANCEYICVMTQDALPTTEYWLYNLYRTMESNKGIGAVSCAEYSRADSDLYHRAFAWNHYKYLGALNEDVVMAYPDSNDPILIRQNGQLSDITCFSKRETLIKYKYRGSFAEDLDLGMRLISDGYKLAFLGNEVSIHSHDRDSYYYLKRRFVELVTLKSIFPNQQIIDYRCHQVIKEMGFLYYYVYQILESWQSKKSFYTFAGFREEFLRQYHCIRKNHYPQAEKLDKLISTNSIDSRTLQFLTSSITQYKKIKPSPEEKYSGVMIDAMEGYLIIVLDFMSECYELVDKEIIKEFSDCVYKILSSVLGTFFAYSYLSSEDDRKHYKEFFNQIGEGV